MKETFLKILKWFFIVLGIIFLIQQILIVLFITAGFTLPFKLDFSDKNLSGKNSKDIQPIINYAEDYFNQNNKYPDSVGEDVKTKKSLNYQYEVSKNNSCYTITVKPDEKQSLLTKNNSQKTARYQHCQDNSENSSSNFQSYVEF